MELTEASAAVAKAFGMDQKGKTMLDKVEPIRGNLGTLFAENPNVEMLFRSSEGKFRPGPAEVITRAMVEGLAPAEFKQIVMVKYSTLLTGSLTSTWSWKRWSPRLRPGDRSKCIANCPIRGRNLRAPVTADRSPQGVPPPT